MENIPESFLPQLDRRDLCVKLTHCRQLYHHLWTVFDKLFQLWQMNSVIAALPQKHTVINLLVSYHAKKLCTLYSSCTHRNNHVPHGATSQIYPSWQLFHQRSHQKVFEDCCKSMFFLMPTDSSQSNMNKYKVSGVLTNADSTAVVHLLAICSRLWRRLAHGNWTDNASQSASTCLILATSGWLHNSKTEEMVYFFIKMAYFVIHLRIFLVTYLVPPNIMGHQILLWIITVITKTMRL